MIDQKFLMSPPLAPAAETWLRTVVLDRGRKPGNTGRRVGAGIPALLPCPPEPSPHGSGLGLTIARGVVQALGGMIEARTPGIDGKGTRIVIQLPLAEEKTPA